MPAMSSKRKARNEGSKAYKRVRSTVALYRPIKQAIPSLDVSRTWWAFNWTPSTTTTNDFWKYFTVSPTSIPNWTEYSNLFDSIRVKSVTWTLRPRYDNFAGNDTTDTTLPGVTNQGSTMVHVVIDPSSPVVPSGTYTSTTLNSFLENGKVRSYRGVEPIVIKIRAPKYADDVNATGGQKYTNGWLSTSIGSTPMRGAHVFAQDVNLTGTFGQSFDVFVTMDFSLRGMR